jgi:GGDEF domain-containing protein
MIVGLDTGVLGLFTGLLLGAATVFFLLQNQMKKKNLEASEINGALTRAARKAAAEASSLRAEVQILQKEQQEGSDLILLFPDIVKIIFSGKDSDEVINFVNRACQNLLKANESAVFLADRTGARLGLSASTGLSKGLEKRINFGLGEGFAGLAAETGRLISREEIEKESVLVKRSLETSELPGFKPEFAAPMQIEGVLYGVITVGAFEGNRSMRKETLRALAAVGAAALENVRLLERFGRSSNLDQETGFLGKNALESTLINELERVERFGSPVAAIELEFKSAEADDSMNSRDIMISAARHLRSSLRNIDIGIRTGRGKIILLLPGTDAEGLNSVTGKLGGELPGLSLDNGAVVGTVGIRGYMVEGGARIEARDLLNRLGSQESKEFEGYYEV